MRDTFLIVDGNSLLYRAFHALPLMDYNGVYTNAVHGFLNMLLRCIRERTPRWCAVAFDEHGPTFRHTAYDAYKAISEEDEREAEAYWGMLLSEYGVEYVEDPTTKKRIPRS